MFENLEDFLESLFGVEMKESKAVMGCGSINYGFWHVPVVSHCT